MYEKCCQKILSETTVLNKNYGTKIWFMSFFSIPGDMMSNTAKIMHYLCPIMS